eukprot:TRINITY_DN15331_c0_g1_i2.p1 TRINITY_DN15331_c0_g1~~TRINITY_DN15331_c0_g1_i2.p1  ORF type:complete len:303 (+),score=42.88 TRINITY_DN15331_c0_g1_i2:88-909(+)
MPDDVSDTHWVGPVAALAVAAILFWIGQIKTTQISADILENCDPESIKDSAKALWTNVGVTAALMVTLVVAMLQADPIEPHGFTLDEDEMKLLANLQQTYITLVTLSILGNLVSMLCCVINLSYVEPLSNTDAIKFFFSRSSADSLGDPITCLMIASILAVLAMWLWVLGSYGIVNAGLFALATMLLCIVLIIAMKNGAAFNPSELTASDYTWTQLEPSKWPKSRKQSGSKMSEKGDTLQVQKVVAKLGKFILDSYADEDRIASQGNPPPVGA